MPVHYAPTMFNLLEGVNYYRKLTTAIAPDAAKLVSDMQKELNKWEQTIIDLLIPGLVVT